jgi:hypothetical protein
MTDQHRQALLWLLAIGGADWGTIGLVVATVLLFLATGSLFLVARKTLQATVAGKDADTLIATYSRVTSMESVRARRALFWLHQENLLGTSAETLTRKQEELIDEVILPLDMMAFAIKAGLLRHEACIPFYYATIERAWECIEPAHESIRTERNSKWAGDLQWLAEECAWWRKHGTYRPVPRTWSEPIDQPRISVHHGPSNQSDWRLDAAKHAVQHCRERRSWRVLFRR